MEKLNIKRIDDDGVIELAGAVVNRAIEDYISMSKKIKKFKEPLTRRQQHVVDEYTYIKYFLFRSEWLKTLSCVDDALYLHREIKRMIRDRRKEEKK